MIGDKFYTNPPLALTLIEETRKIIDFSKIDIFLEPSAGGGSFFYQLDEEKREGLDLYPEINTPEIREQDFFTFVPKSKRYLTIGNPPFGRVSSLAVKFFNKAAEFSSYIAFIVPRTFKRVSIQNRLNPHFHLIHEIPIPKNSFTPSMAVKCVFQIWEHREEKRSIQILQTFSSDFFFVRLDKREIADFAMLAYGGKCGRIVRDIPISGLRSWHFIKVKEGKEIETVISKLESLDYSVSEDTARQNSIGMKEVFALYNKS